MRFFLVQFHYSWWFQTLQISHKKPRLVLRFKCVRAQGRHRLSRYSQQSKILNQFQFSSASCNNFLCRHICSFFRLLLSNSPRSYGAVQLIWGPVASTKWSVMWNPMSKDVPAAIFHHHPCHYSIKPLESMELFDCDNMVGRLREILEIYAVQVISLP